MSAQTMDDAWAPIVAHQREQVLRATWGHLAPQKGASYRGSVVFAFGCFGSDHLNPTVLFCDFDGLDSSPWFYDALITFLGTKGGKAGAAFVWSGEFKNYKFRGRFRRVDLRPCTLGSARQR